MATDADDALPRVPDSHDGAPSGQTRVMPGRPAPPDGPFTEHTIVARAAAPPPSSSNAIVVTSVPEQLDADTDAKPRRGGIVKKYALFREEAVESYLATMRESEVLRVSPPWARGVLAVASFIVVCAVAAAFVIKVEQTGRGRGVLRVAGIRGIATQSSGVVLELGARSGDVVEAGALLARIDSTATKMALLEAERDITRAEEDVAGFLSRRDKEQAERIALLNQRAGLLSRRAQNQKATVGRLAQRVAAYEKLSNEGLAPALEKGEVENEAAAAQRSYIELQEQLSSTRLEISNISVELAQELERRNAAVQKAKDRREALTFQLQQTEVRSPASGRVEALVAKVGDAVTIGNTIARLIPEGVPRQVVVFLPEADRAFLREGSEVRVELDQLPAGEFGSLRARVARIASDLATPADVTEALGDTKLEGPSFRVELELEDAATVKKLDRLLRPGSLVTARFVLRTRRLATLLFEPLKRFFS